MCVTLYLKIYVFAQLPSNKAEIKLTKNTSYIKVTKNTKKFKNLNDFKIGLFQGLDHMQPALASEARGVSLVSKKLICYIRFICFLFYVLIFNLASIVLTAE